MDRGGVLLGPLDIEDEVVIAKARHSGNGAGSILTAVEADEGKALGKERKKSIQGTASQMTPPHGWLPAHLGLAGGLVLRQVDAGDGAEGPKELL